MYIQRGREDAPVSGLAPEMLIAAFVAQGMSMDEAVRLAAEAAQTYANLTGQDVPAAVTTVPVRRKLYQLTGPYRRWKATKYPRAYHGSQRSHFKHILRHLGKLDWEHITPERIEQYQQDRSKELTYKKTPPSAQQINLECNTLYACLSWWTGKKLPASRKTMRIPYHPMQGWDDMEGTTSERRHFVVSRDDILRFLESAEPVFRLMIMLSCETGMREGEVIHLEWHEVDLANRRINLAKDPKFYKLANGREVTWKTKARKDRTIILSTLALEVLRKVPRHVASRWVFPNPRTNGASPYPKQTVYGWLCRAREDAKLMNLGKDRSEPLWFHALRRNWASTMMEHGMDPEMLRQFGGWSSEEVARLYKKVSPTYAAKALKTMDQNPFANDLFAVLRGERRDPQPARAVVKSGKQEAAE